MIGEQELRRNVVLWMWIKRISNHFERERLIAGRRLYDILAYGCTELVEGGVSRRVYERERKLDTQLEKCNISATKHGKKDRFLYS